MNDARQPLLQQLESTKLWDMVVVGGGATGLSCAWDAVSRGLKVLLVESSDFASATSSRSTKLIHGGVRYLQNLEIDLVKEALAERHLLLKNAPEFCQPVRFVLPTNSKMSSYYYRTGLALYDKLAGNNSDWINSHILNKEEVTTKLPNLNLDDLSGGVSYSDAQFDDTALSIALAQAINSNGGLAINYVRLKKMDEENGVLKSATVEDKETGQKYNIKAKSFINATGIYADHFRYRHQCDYNWCIQLSRGSHIVTSQKTLSSKHALIIPKTSDGRVLFAIPWMNHTVIGTTDVATQKLSRNPQPDEQELDFLLNEAKKTLGVDANDILSQWAGLRPLVSKIDQQHKGTKSISRKHVIELSTNGLISVLGGKWTTARSMAEDAIDAAVTLHKLSAGPSETKHRKLTDYGALPPLTTLNTTKDISNAVTPSSVEKAIDYYYVRTIEDLLARRFRAVFLDAKKATTQAERIVFIMAMHFDWSQETTDSNLENFNQYAKTFAPHF